MDIVWVIAALFLSSDGTGDYVFNRVVTFSKEDVCYEWVYDGSTYDRESAKVVKELGLDENTVIEFKCVPIDTDNLDLSNPADTDTAGYFNSASNMLRVGDMILANVDTDSANPGAGIFIVNYNEGSVVDIANITQVGSTDTD